MFKNPLTPKIKNETKTPKPYGKQPHYDDRTRSAPAGISYGTGFKAKVGSLRGTFSDSSNVPKKSLRMPPKSVA